MEMYNFIGDNAPNYRIELSGGDDFKENLIEKQYNNSSNTSLPVKMGDKYIVASINTDGFLQLDVFYTNKFLYGDFEADEVVIYKDIKSYNYPIIPIEDITIHNQCIQATVLDSGELQIYINKTTDTFSGGYVISGYNYEELNFNSVIYEINIPTDVNFNPKQSFGITQLYKTRAGYIVLGLEQPYNTNEGYFFKRMSIYSSADKGQSWDFKFNIGSGFGTGLVNRVNGFFPFDNKAYAIITFSTLSNAIIEIDNKGNYLGTIYSDSGHDFRTQFTFEYINGNFIIVSGFYSFNFYKSTKNESFLDLAMYAYAKKLNLPTLNKNKYLKSSNFSDKILVLTVDINGTYFTVVEPLKTAINQDVIDISIDRPKNMIGSATIKLNNYLAKYSPDGKTNPYKLFPNKEIVIYLGYGKDLKKAFTGYIDNINMNSFPHIITIQCRDTLKLCKDQLLYYNNKYTNTFKNRTPENLFRILCNASGVRYGTVEKTGIRLAEVEWNYISVYDCMEEIAELSGFELSCDENGVVHFREEKPKKDQPVVKEFKEGVNITTLDYTIDDNELYHSVIAQGKKEKEITVRNKKGKKVKKKVEEIISYREYWGPRNFYNLPENKILVIDANEADNKTDLKKITDQALYLMTCRARQVSFEAIADTSLRVGDMIKVTETGSTISEIYRITSIGFNLSNSGYTMSIECYHHRSLDPEEEKEE